VVVGRFEEVPAQAPLTESGTAQSAADRSFGARGEALADECNVEVAADEIVSHDTKHTIVNFADGHGVDAVVAEHEPLRLRSRLLGDPVDWVVRHAPCDVLLVDNVGYDAPERIVLSGDGSPYDSRAVSVAEALATANDGTLSLWHPDDGDTDSHRRTMADYQSALSELLAVPVRAEAVRPDGGHLVDPDVLVRSGPDHRLRAALFDDRPVVPSPGCTTVTVYPEATRRPPLGRRLIERFVF
jgi:nucleotide-binding universal stress UspA family protein